MTRPQLLLVWLGCAGTAWPALRGQDAGGADAIWEAVSSEPPGALVRVDAARVNVAVAPWQEAWSRSRARVQQVAQERRARLPHDRGGRRRPIELVEP